MEAVENPVLGKHWAAKPINIFKIGIVNGNKRRKKNAAYFRFVAAPEEIYFRNWKGPNPITSYFYLDKGNIYQTEILEKKV